LLDGDWISLSGLITTLTILSFPSSLHCHTWS